MRGAPTDFQCICGVTSIYEEANERACEKALAEKNAHEDQDFGRGVHYGIRRTGYWVAHSLSVGMAGK
jgi:hypothetical protein